MNLHCKIDCIKDALEFQKGFEDPRKTQGHQVMRCAIDMKEEDTVDSASKEEYTMNLIYPKAEW